MRFSYSTIAPARHESDSLPWLPLVLRVGVRAVKAVGLVDSGATVNVLPFELGVELGAVWGSRKGRALLVSCLPEEQDVPCPRSTRAGLNRACRR